MVKNMCLFLLFLTVVVGCFIFEILCCLITWKIQVDLSFLLQYFLQSGEVSFVRLQFPDEMPKENY